MNILLVDRTARIGGGVTYLRNLIAALHQRDHRCELMIRGGPALGSLQQVVGPTWWLPLSPWWAAAKACKIIDSRQIDLVNTLTTGSARHVLPACRRTGTPLIITVLTRTTLDKCLQAVDYAHAVVTLNSNTFDYFARRYPQFANKLHLSSKPLLRPSVPASHQASPDGITITYMARLSRSKGPPALELINACHRLDHTLPNFRLTIVGSGSLHRRVRHHAAQVNRQLGREAVRAPGQTLHPDRYFAQSDIIIGAGYSAVQALGWHCTVIGLGFAGLFGLVTADNIDQAISANFGDTGAQWPQPNPGLLAEQIIAASRQVQVPDDWVDWILEEHFNPAKIAQDLEDLFEEAIASIRAG